MVGLAAAIACLGAPVAVPASAEPVASGGLAGAEARAAALSAQAVSAARRAHQLTVAYRIDVGREEALSVQAARSRSSLGALRRQTGRTEATLRSEAVFAYADSAPDQSTPTLKGFIQASDRQEYLDVAVGNLTETLDKYQSEQDAVSSEVATLRAQLLMAQATAAEASAARLQALADAATVERLLAAAQSQVTGLKAKARAEALAAQTAAAGPPVGNGIVETVNQQLGTAGTIAGPSATSSSPTGAPPAVKASALFTTTTQRSAGGALPTSSHLPHKGPTTKTTANAPSALAATTSSRASTVGTQPAPTTTAAPTM